MKPENQQTIKFYRNLYQEIPYAFIDERYEIMQDYLGMKVSPLSVGEIAIKYHKLDDAVDKTIQLSLGALKRYSSLKIQGDPNKKLQNLEKKYYKMITKEEDLKEKADPVLVQYIETSISKEEITKNNNISIEMFNQNLELLRQQLESRFYENHQPEIIEQKKRQRYHQLYHQFHMYLRPSQKELLHEYLGLEQKEKDLVEIMQEREYTVDQCISKFKMIFNILDNCQLRTKLNLPIRFQNYEFSPIYQTSVENLSGIDLKLFKKLEPYFENQLITVSMLPISEKENKLDNLKKIEFDLDKTDTKSKIKSLRVIRQSVLKNMPYADLTTMQQVMMELFYAKTLDSVRSIDEICSMFQIKEKRYVEKYILETVRYILKNQTLQQEVKGLDQNRMECLEYNMNINYQKQKRELETKVR